MATQSGVVRELLIKFGFKIDEAALKRLDTQIDKIKSSAMGANQAIFGLKTNLEGIAKTSPAISRVAYAMGRLNREHSRKGITHGSNPLQALRDHLLMRKSGWHKGTGDVPQFNTGGMQSFIRRMQIHTADRNIMARPFLPKEHKLDMTAWFNRIRKRYPEAPTPKPQGSWREVFKQYTAKRGTTMPDAIQSVFGDRGGLPKVVSNIAKFGGGMGKLSLAFGKIGIALFAMQRAIGLVTSGLSTMWGRVVKPAISMAATIAQTEKLFENILGNKGDAVKLRKEIQQYAIETPSIDFEKALSGTQQLVAMGVPIDQALDVFKSVAPIAAVLGTDLHRITYNLGQVVSQGRLTGPELRDFARQGVPVLDQIAKNLNKTVGEVQDMVPRREISADMVVQALKDMSGPGGRFEGILSSRAATSEGRIDIITQKWQAMLGDIGQAFDGTLGGMLDSIMSFMDANHKTIVELGGRIFHSFTIWSHELVNIGTKLMDWLPTILTIVDWIVIAIGAALRIVYYAALPLLALLKPFSWLLSFGKEPKGIIGHGMDARLVNTMFGGNKVPDMNQNASGARAIQNNNNSNVRIQNNVNVEGSADTKTVAMLGDMMRKQSMETARMLQRNAVEVVVDNTSGVSY
jgi:tape measure domain-containing protein